MKIAYIHGLESTITPDHPKIIWLNDNASETYTPQINYRNPNAFDKIFNYIKKMKPDIIVGSSMGGYFSYIIGGILGIDTVLFNPAMVGRSFDPLVPDTKYEFRDTNHSVYFGKKDRVIDGAKVREFFSFEGFGTFDFNYYNGGHRVPFDIFTTAIKNKIKKY
jgi:uncharacterized protein